MPSKLTKAQKKLAKVKNDISTILAKHKVESALTLPTEVREVLFVGFKLSLIHSRRSQRCPCCKHLSKEMKKANFMVVERLIMQLIKMTTSMAKCHFEMNVVWSLTISIAFDKSFHSSAFAV